MSLRQYETLLLYPFTAKLVSAQHQLWNLITTLIGLVLLFHGYGRNLQKPIGLLLFDA